VLSRLRFAYGPGYVDAGLSDFNIGDAMQADGTPIDLAFVDFVKVQCAIPNLSGTEMKAPQDMSLHPETTVSGSALNLLYETHAWELDMPELAAKVDGNTLTVSDGSKSKGI
jgi:hypothetical protein